MKKSFALLLAVVLVMVIFSACGAPRVRVPRGHQGPRIGWYPSPDDAHELHIYRTSGGATVGFSIVGVLVNKSDGSRRTIYWEFQQDVASVQWLSNDEVEINGRQLNIHRDVYHWRRDPNWAGRTIQ